MKTLGSRALSCAALIAVFTLPGVAHAHDKWEAGGGTFCADDVAPNCNQLIHGQPQTHDLEGAIGADLDFMAVETRARRSYEVRAFNSNQAWTGLGTVNTSIVDRVNAAGTVLTAGFAPDTPGPSSIGTWNAVRWVGAADQRDFIRVRSNLVVASTANDQYDVELLETTYFVPRWNASGGQVTVFLVQNTTTGTVGGTLFLYNAAGALLHSEPLSVPRDGLQIFTTATLGALTGLSGHAQIAHLGGWGALSVKSVALEPATGFSFDTPGAQRPR